VRRNMFRLASIPLVAAILGALGVFGYSYATRTASGVPELHTPTAGQIGAASNTVQATVPQAESAPSANQKSAPPQLASTEAIERWIAEASSTDPGARAAAIAALAGAPKSSAIPVLEAVLERGEAQVDRQIAVRSLHTIALQQGDENGRVREVLRAAMYHGDDEGVAQSAQAVLEDIETELAKR
jgi:hypothetical protein